MSMFQMEPMGGAYSLGYRGGIAVGGAHYADPYYGGISVGGAMSAASKAKSKATRAVNKQAKDKFILDQYNLGLAANLSHKVALDAAKNLAKQFEKLNKKPRKAATTPRAPRLKAVDDLALSTRFMRLNKRAKADPENPLHRLTEAQQATIKEILVMHGGNIFNDIISGVSQVGQAALPFLPYVL